MPFTPRRDTPPPARPSAPPKDDLLRLGGLYPSPSGKALTGSIRLTYTRRGSTDPIGMEFADLLQQCLDEGRDLRFVVFEDNGKFPNAPPYSINVTMARPRAEQPEASQGYTGEEAAGLEDAEPLPPPPIPATPSRPVRRTAPRRA